MFTDDKDSRLVNNEQCVTFQPNTIVYAIPSASNLGKRETSVQNLELYFTPLTLVPVLADLNAQFGADVSQLQGDPDVMVFSSDFKDATGVASMTAPEKQQLNMFVRRAEGSLKQASLFLDLLGGYGQVSFR